jgi:epoxide hydrolase
MSVAWASTFIHEHGKGPSPTPLLLLHGFPESFYRYHKVIDRLTDPAKYGGDPNTSFDVFVPSIPGTGFSDLVTMDAEASAGLFARLMTEVLGYERFVSAGGDHGAIITQALARKRPELLLGIHLIDVGTPISRPTSQPSRPPRSRWRSRCSRGLWKKESASI